MKLILPLMILSSTVFAQDYKRCKIGQIDHTQKISAAICDREVKKVASDYFLFSNTWRYDLNVCQSKCEDINGELIARVRVDMYSNCESEEAFFKTTVIRFEK